LGAVGARIWTLLQEPRTVGEIRDILIDEYEVELERCERDLLTLLQRLADKGLLEVRAETTS
jgi:predicted transcriptional regulator